ncbi:MAG: argD [Gemmataceae bacterium]|nr:argD [Gemmataceae bacterium]
MAERDERSVAPEEPADGVQVARSERSFVFDHHGKRYIDFVMGWCVGNLGWGNEDVLAPIRNFDGPAYVQPDYLCRPWSGLTEVLAPIMPVKRANYHMWVLEPGYRALTCSTTSWSKLCPATNK